MYSIHIIGSLRRRRGKGAENIFEAIIAENFHVKYVKYDVKNSNCRGGEYKYRVVVKMHLKLRDQQLKIITHTR